MKIGIDARFAGPQGTGLGKYTEKLIENLQKIDKKNRFILFLRKSNWDYLKLTEKNFEKSLADVKWYSLEEQYKLPKIFSEKNLDLLHIPHFNAPIFYKGKFIVTIHDLIHHHFNESSSTTKNMLAFRLKRFGYHLIINNAIKKCSRILVPSKFVKDEIIKYFHVDSEKIAVTYEAAEEEYFDVNRFSAPRTQKPYLLYVGNVYPHKNIEKLLDALKLIKSELKLSIVCPRNVFEKRIQETITTRSLEKRVEFMGYLPTSKLKTIFQKASAYVFPSLSEGFGIPGLNAMAASLPVIAANIPTLKEIYGDAALYFDPRDPKDIAEKIHKILSDPQTRSFLIQKGNEQVKKYSWQKMATETLNVYESV